ncbi:hypothetical protein CALCODRAFT_506070 [Calocera cornea HHB12733]|uniref:Uncharacterized protein n=1 Tax=Calocera cornea HHB12733 TaxID=1353952 RepID=A0A165JES7_9BASI|nr:hypothetical protein CALCODRAFT_506070 [Calocera cornea HHB12733]
MAEYSITLFKVEGRLKARPRQQPLTGHRISQLAEIAFADERQFGDSWSSPNKTAYSLLVLNREFFASTTSVNHDLEGTDDTLVLGPTGLQVCLYDMSCVPRPFSFSQRQPGQGAIVTSILTDEHVTKSYAYDLLQCHLIQPSNVPDKSYYPPIAFNQPDIRKMLQAIVAHGPDSADKCVLKLKPNTLMLEHHKQFGTLIPLTAIIPNAVSLACDAEELIMVLYSSVSVQADLTVYIPHDALLPVLFYLRPSLEQRPTWSIHFLLSQTSCSIYDLLPSLPAPINPPPMPLAHSPSQWNVETGNIDRERREQDTERCGTSTAKRTIPKKRVNGDDAESASKFPSLNNSRTLHLPNSPIFDYRSIQDKVE